MNFNSDVWWFALITGAVTSIIGFFLKQTFKRLEAHEKTIAEIQRTYVTKIELKEIKDDINQLKEKMLTKEDYYRSQLRMEQKIDKQNEKIDKMYDALLNIERGRKDE